MVKHISYPKDTITREAYNKLIRSHPDRVPVIVTELHHGLELRKTKFLVPLDLTVGQLHYVFRKSLKLKDSESIFAFVSNRYLLNTSMLMSDVHEKHNSDGFVKVALYKENTFG
tara:strand:+ start:7317 stop:7658 length:342 start_codon:yes stop_codon:yes gene_type:complete